jgi:hypothetical protein
VSVATWKWSNIEVSNEPLIRSLPIVGKAQAFLFTE